MFCILFQGGYHRVHRIYYVGSLLVGNDSSANKRMLIIVERIRRHILIPMLFYRGLSSFAKLRECPLYRRWNPDVMPVSFVEFVNSFAGIRQAEIVNLDCPPGGRGFDRVVFIDPI